MASALPLAALKVVELCAQMPARLVLLLREWLWASKDEGAVQEACGGRPLLPPRREGGWGWAAALGAAWGLGWSARRRSCRSSSWTRSCGAWSWHMVP